MMTAETGWDTPAPAAGPDTPVMVEDLPPAEQGPHPDGVPVGVAGGAATAAGAVGWAVVTGVGTVLCSPCLCLGCGALCFSPALGWTALLAVGPLVLLSHGAMAVSMAVQAGITVLAPGWFQGRTSHKMKDLLWAQAGPLLLGWAAAGMLLWAAAAVAMLGTASAGYLGLTSQTELAPWASMGFVAAAFLFLALVAGGAAVGLLGQLTAVLFAVLAARAFEPDAQEEAAPQEEEPKPKKKAKKKKKHQRRKHVEEEEEDLDAPAPPSGWGEPPSDDGEAP